MTVLGSMDAPLDLFGGLVTDMSPADVPAGVSPDCADVAFTAGAVKTRPGLVSMYAPLAGNPTINYLKTFIQPDLVQTLLALDSAGTLWGELTPGVLSQVATGLVAGARAKSATLFGREVPGHLRRQIRSGHSRGSTTARISIASARWDRAPRRLP